MEKLSMISGMVLMECSLSDKVWVWGFGLNDDSRRDAGNWGGSNLLGFALMKVRDMLRRESKNTGTGRKLYGKRQI